MCELKNKQYTKRHTHESQLKHNTNEIILWIKLNQL